MSFLTGHFVMEDVNWEPKCAKLKVSFLILKWCVDATKKKFIYLDLEPHMRIFDELTLTLLWNEDIFEKIELWNTELCEIKIQAVEFKVMIFHWLEDANIRFQVRKVTIKDIANSKRCYFIENRNQIIQTRWRCFWKGKIIFSQKK